jgi:hypothetical protein
MIRREPDIESIGKGRALLRSRGLTEDDLSELAELLDHSDETCEAADAMYRRRHGNGHANEWPIDEQEI